MTDSFNMKILLICAIIAIAAALISPMQISARSEKIPKNPEISKMSTEMNAFADVNVEPEGYCFFIIRN
ncbi:MAG: hypothetical protein J5U17_04460 [Candidatus Methanoperedens sp.]|nr:hypothetical protein [Candidatus Methanoperedens sp.]MCE8427242.1 hypothetical protein [Candidatus Methanoperedens sp.]